MFRIHAETSFRDWVLSLDTPRRKRVAWSLGVLKQVGALDPVDTKQRKVVFSRVTYDGHPMFRVEACGDETSENPAAFGYLRDGDEIYVVAFGGLSDIGLATMLNEGIVTYLRLKGDRS